MSTIDTSAFRGLFSMHMVVPQLDLLIRPEKMDHAHSPHHAGYLAPYVRALHIHARAPVRRGDRGPRRRTAGQPTDRRPASTRRLHMHACMHAFIISSITPGPLQSETIAILSVRARKILRAIPLFYTARMLCCMHMMVTVTTT